MTTYNTDFELNLTAGGIMPRLNCSQFDREMKTFTAYLYNNDEPITIPTDAQVVLWVRLPDGTEREEAASATADSKGIIFAPTQEMTAKKGTLICNFEIIDEANDGDAFTENFILVVNPAPRYAI